MIYTKFAFQLPSNPNSENSSVQLPVHLRIVGLPIHDSVEMKHNENNYHLKHQQSIENISEVLVTLQCARVALNVLHAINASNRSAVIILRFPLILSQTVK
jgi:hypothetical protein